MRHTVAHARNLHGEHKKQYVGRASAMCGETSFWPGRAHRMGALGSAGYMRPLVQGCKNSAQRARMPAPGRVRSRASKHALQGGQRRGRWYTERKGGSPNLATHGAGWAVRPAHPRRSKCSGGPRRRCAAQCAVPFGAASCASMGSGAAWRGHMPFCRQVAIIWPLRSWVGAGAGNPASGRVAVTGPGSAPGSAVAATPV